VARLRATARAVDIRPRRTSQTSRIAVSLFDVLRRAGAAPLFDDPAMRRLLRLAARMHAVGNGAEGKSPQTAARQFLLGLTIPPGWNTEEWQRLAWIVRYHRGAEPNLERGAFSKLSEGQQREICLLAGVLRLARALRKSGIETGAGLRAEKSFE